MFEKPWNSVKRMLLTGLCLTTLLAPYESEAAPKNRNRSERLSKKNRREAKRRNRQRQPERRPTTRNAPKPTLEENLSPAQVDRKIQTIRKRIETAPENQIPTRDKKVLLEVFDDMAQTQMGRYIFEKVHPDLNFKIEHMGSGYNGTYSNASRCINFAQRVFEDIHKVKTPEQKLYEKLYIAHVIAHEATHSIQHVNNMNRFNNMSFEERITINKLFELHAILNETMVRYQVGNLPKHRQFMPNSHKRCREHIPGKTNLVPMHLFFRELKEAKMATGADEKTAERFARTKFVETFWQNNGQTPIQVGDRTVDPTTSNVSEVLDTWNGTYNIVAVRRLPRSQYSYQKAMINSGITKNIQRFINVMEIDTPPSFFRNPKTTPFKMSFSKRFVSYMDGIKDLEIDTLATGSIRKVSHLGNLYYIKIETTQKQEAQKDGPRTEFYDGNRIKRATYTYRNGKMNGIYREYDQQGNQIMEIPVENDVPHGEAWILENGVRIKKNFYKGRAPRNRTRE